MMKSERYIVLGREIVVGFSVKILHDEVTWENANGRRYATWYEKNVFETIGEAEKFLAKKIKQEDSKRIAEVLSDDYTKCIMGVQDVAKAEKKLAQFNIQKGTIYSMSEHKYPNKDFFFRAYFGEEDYNEYVGQCFKNVPSVFIAKNKNAFEVMKKFLGNFTYHDSYNQVYADLEVFENKMICVLEHGDY